MDGAPGNPGPAGADGVLKSRTSTGQFEGTFGPCGSGGGAWLVCPAAFRSVAIAAAAGDVLQWQLSTLLGVVTATADAEFDLAAVDNTTPGSPVVLRALSSGVVTPLPNGDGGLYCWSGTGRRLPGAQWVVQAGDIISGTVTLALLYHLGGSGLSVGRATLYPSRVDVTNLGTPRV